jgi:tetratricopeptide (TPR) repeat protein
MSDPVLLLGEPGDDPFTLLLYLFIHHHGAIARNDHNDAYHWSRRIVDLIESEPAFRDRLADRHIPAQHNLCMAIVQSGRVEEFDQAYRKLLALAARARAENRNFDDLTIRMLAPRVELARGNFEKAATLLEPLEAAFGASGEALRIGFGTYFNYLFAYCYFGAGKYRRALAWLANILNDRNVSTHEELHCHARILSLLVHYELGNFDNLEFYLASTVRFLTRRNRLLAMESLVIEMIRKLLAAPEGPAARRIMAETRKRMRTATAEPGTIDLLDADAWIESKLTGEHFAAIVRRKLAGDAGIADHHDIDERSALCA